MTKFVEQALLCALDDMSTANSQSSPIAPEYIAIRYISSEPLRYQSLIGQFSDF
jgi:hypothetical protein